MHKIAVFILLAIGAFGQAPYRVDFKTVPVNDRVTLEVAIATSATTNPTDGPVLLILHGFPEAWTCFKNTIPYFLSHDPTMTLILPNQRGINGSSTLPSPSDYHIENLVSDLDTVLQQTVGDRPVHVISHDWGGMVSWYFAYSYPERVQTLTTVSAPHLAAWSYLIATDPRQQAASEYIFAFRIPNYGDVLTGNDLAGLRGIFALEPWFEGQNQIDLETHWRKPGSVQAGLDWYTGNILLTQPNSWRNVTFTFPPGFVIRQDIPVVMIVGLRDTAFAWPQSIDVSRTFVSGTFDSVILPNEAHWIPHTQPELVADVAMQNIQKFESSN